MSGGAATSRRSRLRRLARSRGGWRRYRVTIAFLAPAAILLGVWIVYPTIYTIVRSFFDREGYEFIGFDNYQELFSQDTLTAIKNNVLWLAIVPALVTAIGLVFAVLLERVRWSVAFKTVVFMPMAISLFAAGVIWRVMDEKDPDIGAVNASIGVGDDDREPAGRPARRAASDRRPRPDLGGGLELQDAVRPGGTALLGLTGIPPEEVPEGAVQARPPEAAGRDHRRRVARLQPGGGKPGVVERGELGLPGVTVELREPAATTSPSADRGRRELRLRGLEQGQYRVAIGAETFEEPFQGVAWLGASLITPAIMLAYIWVWAGFAMVVIGAGLAAIPRDLLEAARTDGASEGQVFRRVTVPLLWPVLVVVFVTMLINVLKIFDIVLSVAPGSVRTRRT